MTQVPLTYSPWTGEGLPSKPERFADCYANSTVFWNFNPWTGIRRPSAEVDADPYGEELAPSTPAWMPEGLLRFQPSTGLPMQYLASADAHRNRFPYASWFYNPWTGSRRPAAEVEADPQGLKLEPPSHDPGTASPPTPATTEAGTGTQEPGATDPTTPTPTPTPTPAPTNAFTRAASALQDLRVENGTLARTATELATKCRDLQAENERLRRALRWVEYQAKNHGPEALPVIAKAASRALSVTPAEEAQTPPEPHMRAAAGEGDQTVNQELLAALQAILASNCQQPAIGVAWAAAHAAIAKATGGTA